jgi:hypothetical protein
MRYQKLHSQIWHDEKFPLLSDQGKLLFIYLLSSPHSNSIGLYVIPKPYIVADLNWTTQQLNKPFLELLDKELIKYDETVKLLIIPNHLKHNPLENQNQTKAAIKIVQTLPKTSIISDLFELLNKPFHKPLLEVLTEQYSEPEEEEEEEKEEKTKEERITCDDIIQGWNDICSTKGFPKVERLTPDRRSKINSRLKIHKDVEFWNKVFNKIVNTSFLTGKNDRGWKVTFDWLFSNDENSTKIYEGNYEK